jgi:hypothetical protein
LQKQVLLEERVRQKDPKSQAFRPWRFWAGFWKGTVSMWVAALFAVMPYRVARDLGNCVSLTSVQNAVDGFPGQFRYCTMSLKVTVWEIFPLVAVHVIT